MRRFSIIHLAVSIICLTLFSGQIFSAIAAVDPFFDIARVALDGADFALQGGNAKEIEAAARGISSALEGGLIRVQNFSGELKDLVRPVNGTLFRKLEELFKQANIDSRSLLGKTFSSQESRYNALIIKDVREVESVTQRAFDLGKTAFRRADSGQNIAKALDVARDRVNAIVKGNNVLFESELINVTQTKLANAVKAGKGFVPTWSTAISVNLHDVPSAASAEAERAFIVFSDAEAVKQGVPGDISQFIDVEAKKRGAQVEVAARKEIDALAKMHGLGTREINLLEKSAVAIREEALTIKGGILGKFKGSLQKFFDDFLSILLKGTADLARILEPLVNGLGRGLQAIKTTCVTVLKNPVVRGTGRVIGGALEILGGAGDILIADQIIGGIQGGIDAINETKLDLLRRALGQLVVVLRNKVVAIREEQDVAKKRVLVDEALNTKHAADLIISRMEANGEDETRVANERRNLSELLLRIDQSLLISARVDARVPQLASVFGVTHALAAEQANAAIDFQSTFNISQGADLSAAQAAIRELAGNQDINVTIATSLKEMLDGLRTNELLTFEDTTIDDRGTPETVRIARFIGRDSNGAIVVSPVTPAEQLVVTSGGTILARFVRHGVSASIDAEALADLLAAHPDALFEQRLHLFPNGTMLANIVHAVPAGNLLFATIDEFRTFITTDPLAFAKIIAYPDFVSDLPFVSDDEAITTNGWSEPMLFAPTVALRSSQGVGANLFAQALDALSVIRNTLDQFGFPSTPEAVQGAAVNAIFPPNTVSPLTIGPGGASSPSGGSDGSSLVVTNNSPAMQTVTLELKDNRGEKIGTYTAEVGFDPLVRAGTTVIMLRNGKALFNVRALEDAGLSIDPTKWAMEATLFVPKNAIVPSALQVDMRNGSGTFFPQSIVDAQGEDASTKSLARIATDLRPSPIEYRKYARPNEPPGPGNPRVDNVTSFGLSTDGKTLFASFPAAASPFLLPNSAITNVGTFLPEDQLTVGVGIKILAPILLPASRQNVTVSRSEFRKQIFSQSVSAPILERTPESATSLGSIGSFTMTTELFTDPGLFPQGFFQKFSQMRYAQSGHTEATVSRIKEHNSKYPASQLPVPGPCDDQSTAFVQGANGHTTWMKGYGWDDGFARVGHPFNGGGKVNDGVRRVYNAGILFDKNGDLIQSQNLNGFGIFGPLPPDGKYFSKYNGTFNFPFAEMLTVSALDERVRNDLGHGNEVFDEFGGFGASFGGFELVSNLTNKRIVDGGGNIMLHLDGTPLGSGEFAQGVLAIARGGAVAVPEIQVDNAKNITTAPSNVAVAIEDAFPFYRHIPQRTADVALSSSVVTASGRLPATYVVRASEDKKPYTKGAPVYLEQSGQFGISNQSRLLGFTDETGKFTFSILDILSSVPQDSKTFGIVVDIGEGGQNDFYFSAKEDVVRLEIPIPGNIPTDLTEVAEAFREIRSAFDEANQRLVDSATDARFVSRIFFPEIVTSGPAVQVNGVAKTVLAQIATLFADNSTNPPPSAEVAEAAAQLKQRIQQLVVSGSVPSLLDALKIVDGALDQFARVQFNRRDTEIALRAWLATAINAILAKHKTELEQDRADHEDALAFIAAMQFAIKGFENGQDANSVVAREQGRIKDFSGVLPAAIKKAGFSAFPITVNRKLQQAGVLDSLNGIAVAWDVVSAILETTQRFQNLLLEMKAKEAEDATAYMQRQTELSALGLTIGPIPVNNAALFQTMQRHLQEFFHGNDQSGKNFMTDFKTIFHENLKSKLIQTITSFIAPAERSGSNILINSAITGQEADFQSLIDRVLGNRGTNTLFAARGLEDIIKTALIVKFLRGIQLYDFTDGVRLGEKFSEARNSVINELGQKRFSELLNLLNGGAASKLATDAFADKIQRFLSSFDDLIDVLQPSSDSKKPATGITALRVLVEELQQQTKK